MDPLDKLSRYPVQSDLWDQTDRNRAVEEMATFAEDREKFGVRISTGEPLYDSVFWSLLQAVPKLAPLGELRPTAWLGSAVMKIGMDLTEWERLRSLGTMGDVDMSAMATTLLSETFGQIHEDLKDLDAQAEQVEQMMQQFGSSGEGEGESQPGSENGGESQPGEGDDEGEASGPGPLDEQRQEQEQQLTEAMTKLAQDIEQAVGAARAPLSAAMGQAADDIQEQGEMIAGWDFSPGYLKKLSTEDRFKLARKLQGDPKLKRVSDLLGLFRRAAFAELRKRVPHGVEELVGLTRSRDLARVLPSELAKLRTPLRGLALAQLVAGELLAYDTTGSAKIGRGAMVVAIDASGSMSGARAEWASAIGFSLQQVAQRQHRPFRGIVFSGRNQFRVFDFQTQADCLPAKVFDFLGAFYGGGTEIQGPLEMGLSWLETDWAERKGVRADMLLVTDGLVGVDPHWQEMFAKRLDAVDGRLHAIVIGMRAGRPVTELANGSVMEARSLTLDEAGEVFKAVID